MMMMMMMMMMMTLPTTVDDGRGESRRATATRAVVRTRRAMSHAIDRSNCWNGVRARVARHHRQTRRPSSVVVERTPVVHSSSFLRSIACVR